MSYPFEESRETITGIAEVLMRESGKSMVEVWDEAMMLYRTQFAKEVLPPREETERRP